MYLNNVGKMPRIAMLIWNGEIEEDHSWNSWELYNNLYLGSKHEFLPRFSKKHQASLEVVEKGIQKNGACLLINDKFLP